jgi:hypothetical protein
LFLQYDFTVVYNSSNTHVVADALSRLPNTTKPIGVLEQTTNVSLFFTKPKWLNDVLKLFKNRTYGRFFVYMTEAKVS